MLKRLMQRLRGQPRPPKLKLQIIPRDRHSLSRQHISSAAKKVLYGLHEAGFQAYLVGGSVRDLLLGLQPKDFDVATNATPEEVRNIFRSSRIIGRRFRLVHVMYGRETVEVATFRAHHQDDTGQGATNATGMIVRDNVYGSIEQDAERRDFTVNALYYHIADFSIHDFAGGVADIERRTLRLIGHPETRYREDPVRMLRAVRFAAKLQFTLDPACAEPIPHLATLLSSVSPHRLFDEVQKLLACGHASQILDMLENLRLLPVLFPSLHANDASMALIRATARSTDERIASGKSINPAFFYAALLWQSVQDRQCQLHDHGTPVMPAWQQASQFVLQRQSERTALTKFTGMAIREIWEMQPRLQVPDVRQLDALLLSPRFRAAFDFLVLREASGEKTGHMGAWWERYQHADPGLQVEMTRALVDHKAAATPNRRKRRPRKRKPA